MKGARSVCLLCRHRLATESASRLPQWQAHVNYSTAEGSKPVDSAAEYDSTRPTSLSFRRIQAHNPYGRESVLNPPPPKRSNVVKSANKIRTKVDMNQLFQNIVTKTNTDDLSLDEHEKIKKSQKLIRNIGILQEMLDNIPWPSKAYAFFKSEVYPSLFEESVNIPQIVYRVVSNLMQKIINVKGTSIEANDLPAVSEIFRVCADVGELKPAQWADLVGKLVESLCEMSTNPADYPSIEAWEAHLSTRDKMVTDLIESWKVLTLPKNMKVPTEDEFGIIDGFWLPRIDKSPVGYFRNTNNLPLAFSRLFPQYDLGTLGAKVPALAIATFTLLMDQNRSNAASRRAASRFLARIAYLITHVGIQEKNLRRHIKQYLPSIEGYVMAQWANISHHLNQIHMATDEPTAKLQNAISPRDGIDAASIWYRLGKLSGSRKAIDVDRLWESFIKHKGSISSDSHANELRQHPDLFNSFINTYMAMDQPDKAIMVWNTLPKIGLKPTLKTWNVMLDGCKRAKNLAALNKIWSRLEASGMQLDVQIWTTRVSGLIHSGDPQGAVRALHDMVKLWEDGLNDKQSTAVRPSIEPVNAVLAGLVRLDKLGAAQKLLSWAGRYGINPDIFTFNTLLRPLIRSNRDEEVRGLFEAMKEANIQADEATFTIVLDGAFAQIDPNDSERQVELVATIFDEMEAAGLRANSQTYGKMLYLLLLSGDRATHSVNAVLEHIWRKNEELSPHIYTMLIEHYFSHRKPETAKQRVDDIVTRRKLLDFEDMDYVLYDRLVKGYTLVGDLDMAFKIYRKLVDAGFLVELSTQFELLKKLVGAQRLNDAREMAESTFRQFREKHGEEYRGPQHSRFWSHRFWEVAARCGLMPVEPEGKGGTEGNATAR